MPYVVAVLLLLISGAIALSAYVRWRRRQVAPSFVVRPGVFARRAEARLGRRDDAVVVRLRGGLEVLGSLPVDGSNEAVDQAQRRRSGTRAALVDVAPLATPAAAALIVGAGDAVYRHSLLDENFTDALTQLSGVQVDGLADFRNLQIVKDYQLDSIKLRGTIGEQQSAEGFEALGHEISWPSGGSTAFGASNNPGWDYAIDGQEINVKVTKDASSAAREHFAEYPDIPLVVNADAANIPESALRFDADNPLEASDLIGENIIVVQESLTMNAVVETQMDGSQALDSVDLDVVVDSIPGVSVLTAAVRSAAAEGRLLRAGATDGTRAAKNVAIDAGIKGGGAAAGGFAGAKAGAAIDAMFIGSTFGLFALTGGLMGVIGGGLFGCKKAKKAKLAPLRGANAGLRGALQSLNARSAAGAAKANNDVKVLLSREEDQFINKAAQIQEAFLQWLDRQRADLLEAARIPREKAAQLLALCGREVDACSRSLTRPVSRLRLTEAERLRAINEAAEWKRAASELQGPVDHDDLGKFFDVIIAAPGGHGHAERFLGELDAARNRRREEAVAANEVMLSALAELRAEAIARTNEEHERVRQRAETELEPLAAAVHEAKKHVHRELLAAGRG